MSAYGGIDISIVVLLHKYALFLVGSSVNVCTTHLYGIHSHVYHDAFEELLGSVVVGTLPRKGAADGREGLGYVGGGPVLGKEWGKVKDLRVPPSIATQHVEHATISGVGWTGLGEA